eukprot:TCONS_00007881-protein
MSDKGNTPLMAGFTRQKLPPESTSYDYGALTTTPAPPTTHPGYNNPSYGPPPGSGGNYSIGFDSIGPTTPIPPIPYGNPSTTQNPVYNPGSASPFVPSMPSNENQPTPLETEVPKKTSFGSRNKVDDSSVQDSEKIGDAREPVNVEQSTMFRDGKRKIDYILAYEPFDMDEARRKNRASKREMFEENLRGLGLELETEDVENSCDGKTKYVKIHIPWKLMCEKAEEYKMKMPLKENEMDIRTFTERMMSKLCWFNPFELEADIPEEQSCYTCAFRMDRIDQFRFPAKKQDFFSNSQRSRVVHRILEKCRYDERKRYQLGTARLIANGSYKAAYPLHAGPYLSQSSELTHKDHTDRQLLYAHWARPGRWYKQQPLDLIRRYFGEKIGLYFTWLGYYTGMLIPAAIMGLLVIIFGLATLSEYKPADDLCNKKLNLPMCPICDEKCDYTTLVDSCSFTKLTYVFDNDFTIVFAIFMSFWATFFLEHWKRKQSEVQYDWDLIGYEDEEEQPRPQFEAKVTTLRLNPITQEEEAFLPNSTVCPRYTVAINCIGLMIILVVVGILSVVLYRIAVYASISTSSTLDQSWVGVIAASTAALINLVFIMVLNKLYERLAHILTEWEMPKTQTMFDDLFTFKMYLFQFVNFYGSLFYIAFFKLDPGTPKQYKRIFGFRPEECNAAGCLFELGLQLCVIMVGKQVFNNFIEVVVPKLMNWWRRRDNVREEIYNLPQWEHDYDLVETSQQGLFYEYLEMVIQYGFITIFVAAFPLGPLFALLNNLFELRVDAYKYVAVFRRHASERTEDIGIWFEILTGVTKMSVVVNAFTIGFVSEFVPRLYYATAVSDGTYDGFLNSTLSCFDINDFVDGVRPTDDFKRFENGSCGFGKQTCRYRGYYEPPYKWHNGTVVRNELAYEYTSTHWHLLAAKLFFVIAFEHVVFAVSGFIGWVIPDIPKRLNEQIKRENYLAKLAIRGETLLNTSP